MRLDEHLGGLLNRVLLLGGETETALQRAMFALSERDSVTAREVLRDDDRIDQLEVEIDRLCIDVLALGSPPHACSSSPNTLSAAATTSQTSAS